VDKRTKERRWEEEDRGEKAMDRNMKKVHAVDNGTILP
jgi:hypothetical protein